MIGPSPEGQHRGNFRPSDSAPHRFYLWLGLSALGAVVILLAPPGFPILGVMLMGLGFAAGGKPSEASGGFKPSAFLAAIYVGIFVVICVAFVLFADASTDPAPRTSAVPVWAKALFGAAVAGYVAIEARRFGVRRRSAAA